MKLIALGLVLAACTGDAAFPEIGLRRSPKVSAIERVNPRNGRMERTELTYRGDQLDRVVQSSGGVVIGTAVLTYGPDGVSHIERTDHQGDREVEDREYDDQGRLLHQRYERHGAFAEEATLSYTGLRPLLITLKEDDGDRYRLHVSYNDQGLTEKLKWSTGDWTEMIYDEAGHLTSANTIFPDDITFWRSYVWVDGRLDKIIASLGPFQLSYDDAGRISEISRGELVTRYTYEAGEVSGWSFPPDIPLGELFDLGGSAVFPMTQDDDFSEYSF